MNYVPPPELLDCYYEPHRAYHNLRHIQWMLMEFEGARHFCKHPENVELAIWFHDAAYNPKAKDNEEQSVVLAKRLLGDRMNPEIERLILLTKHDKTPAATDIDGQIMIDCDLAIFGADKIVFDEYEAGIRREYSFVPQAMYCEERIKVLERFIDNGIFRSKHFQERYHFRAIMNLRELCYDLNKTISPKKPIPSSVNSVLGLIDDKNRDACSRFYTDYRDIIDIAPGSRSKHQPWPGGYIDHLCETVMIAEKLYNALSQIRPLAFSLADAAIVLFIHDIEKPFKYDKKNPINLPDMNSRKVFVRATLQKYGIVLTEEQNSAYQYIEGEGEDYNPDSRVQNALGAFCHCCDNISARIWFDQPKF